jgi:hypothetical protein
MTFLRRVSFGIEINESAKIEGATLLVHRGIDFELRCIRQSGMYRTRDPSK